MHNRFQRADILIQKIVADSKGVLLKAQNGDKTITIYQVQAAQDLQHLTWHVLNQVLGYRQKTKKDPNPKQGDYIEEFLTRTTCMFGSQTGGGEEEGSEEQQAPDDLEGAKNHEKVII